MKILQRARLWIVFFLFVVAAGCIGEAVKFNPIAEQKYDATKSRIVTSSACGFQLLLVIPIQINDRAQRAYNDLLTQAGYDYLTDIKVQEKWYYALVGTVYCTEFLGTVHPKLSASGGAGTQQ